MKNFFKSHVKLCIAVLALSLVTVGATLALMVSQSNSVTNQFTAADVDTEINEVLTSGSKQVSITNHGRSDAYVRARIMVSGVKSTDVVIVTSTDVENKDLAADENKGKVFLVMDYEAQNPAWNWAKESGNVETYSDDFYYYLAPLKTGDETTNLLEKVVLGSDLRSDQDFLANFTVTIYHESVLAINQPEEGTSPDLDMVKGAFTAAENSAS